MFYYRYCTANSGVYIKKIEVNLTKYNTHLANINNVHIGVPCHSVGSENASQACMYI